MGLICLCQGCGVQADTLSKLLYLASGTFGFVHGALFFGRVLGSSDDTSAAVANNMRGLTGANATEPNEGSGSEDVRRAPPPAQTCAMCVLH